MKKLCVFCGSSAGSGPAFKEAAFAFGVELAKNNIGLVFGGGNSGIMGAVADGVLSQNGFVQSVIPQFFVDAGAAHPKAQETIIVETMHERKAKMYDLADGFVTFPGGIGTLDEFCEILTWAQLQKHYKPCFIFNQNGFYDYFIKHLQHTTETNFLSQKDLDLLRIHADYKKLLQDFLSQK